MRLSAERSQRPLLRWMAFLAVLSMLTACAGDRVSSVIEETYGADRVVVRDFIGTLVIETAEEDAEIGVRIDATRAQADLMPISVSDGVLSISWEGEPNRKRAWYEFWRGRWMADLNRIETYPAMTLIVPAQIEVEIINIIGVWTVGQRAGRLIVDADRGSGAIAGAQSAMISITGDADIELGPITDGVEVAVAGSGSLRGASAARAALSIAGSGDIVLGDVAGELVVSVSGSGEASVGRSGSANATVSGSGSVDLGGTGDSLRAVVQGSGRVTAESVDGAFEASVSGSGSITIDDGRASPMMVTIAGSGSVRFGGVAVRPTASLSGSGSLYLNAVEGEVDARTAGSGSVQLGR